MERNHTILIQWGVIVVTCCNKRSTTCPAKVSPTMVLIKEGETLLHCIMVVIKYTNGCAVV